MQCSKILLSLRCFLVPTRKGKYRTLKVNQILAQIPNYQYIAIGVLLLLFLMQFIQLSRFSIVANHRHRFRLKNEGDIPPVSVVVIVDENVDYIYEELPKLLNQDHPNYEVVVVNDCGGNEVTNALATLSANNPRLRYTVIKPDDRFKHSRKIALVVGIKAAKHNNLVFTHTNVIPESSKWLTFMARGFVGSEIVISYAGFEPKKGLAAKLIRASWLKTSVGYLSSATKGKAYRGTFYNIGYTKDIFFKSRGYTHLRLALGEDDLFIQKIARQDNVAVIINPHTTVRMPICGGKHSLRWWWNDKRYHSYPFRYYPFRVKVKQFLMEFLKTLFFLTNIAFMTFSILAICGVEIGFSVVFPISMLSIVAGFSLLREILLLRGVKKACNRLGEKGFLFGYFIHDKISPITSAILSISRRLKPPQGLWR